MPCAVPVKEGVEAASDSFCAPFSSAFTLFPLRLPAGRKTNVFVRIDRCAERRYWGESWLLHRGWCLLGVATRCVPVGPRSMLSALAADDLLPCIECRNSALLLRARQVGGACICPTACDARHARDWEVASSAARTVRSSSDMAPSSFAGGRQRAWTSSGLHKMGYS